MEKVDITLLPDGKSGGGIQVAGFPDAVKVVKINGPKVKEIRDLVLHRGDLLFSKECLESINKTDDSLKTVRQSLWQSAITNMLKCFGNSVARKSLEKKKVLEGDLEGQIVFQNFRDLRNKHIVHDENGYSQGLVGAVLNGGDKEYKIEKLYSLL